MNCVSDHLQYRNGVVRLLVRNLGRNGRSKERVPNEVEQMIFDYTSGRYPSFCQKESSDDGSTPIPPSDEPQSSNHSSTLIKPIPILIIIAGISFISVANFLFSKEKNKKSRFKKNVHPRQKKTLSPSLLRRTKI